MASESTGSGERSLILPCRLAGQSCPPELGQQDCVLTGEHIRMAQSRGDVDLLAAFALCQMGQNQTKGRGLVVDAKTGLDNVELMLEKARQRFIHPPRKMDQIVKAGRHILTALVTFVDIDHFKGFNANYGHKMGDDVLRAVARHLESKTRESDLRGRWGGDSDEMVAIMGGMTRQQADKKADDLERSFAAGVTVQAPEGDIVTVTAGVGSAYVEDIRGFHDLERALDFGDRALMEWKTGDRQGAPERQYLIGSVNPLSSSRPSS